MNPTNPSSVDATPEQVSMARRIADELIPNPDNESVVYKSFHQTAERAALAAIIETTEAAAKLADQIESVENGRAWDKRQAGRDDNFNCARASAANAFAAALRNNDHLKGPQQRPPERPAMTT